MKYIKSCRWLGDEAGGYEVRLSYVQSKCGWSIFQSIHRFVDVVILSSSDQKYYSQAERGPSSLSRIKTLYVCQWDLLAG